MNISTHFGSIINTAPYSGTGFATTGKQTTLPTGAVAIGMTVSATGNLRVIPRWWDISLNGYWEVGVIDCDSGTGAISGTVQVIIFYYKP